jgi:hypothetical protein
MTKLANGIVRAALPAAGYEKRENMKWTTHPPTRPGWYWFESAPLNLAARIVRVQEECGSLMLDDHETQLYDAVEMFAGALWSDEPMPEPEGTPIIERVMLAGPKRDYKVVKRRGV